MLRSLALKTEALRKTGDGRLVARLVFGLAVFISAFLLFQVQLLMGKFLLPWFGGRSGVLAYLSAFLSSAAAWRIFLCASGLDFLPAIKPHLHQIE